jgi:SAM-dependent methyltransferase
MHPMKSVDDLMAAGTGYQRSMMIFAGLRLGVFAALAEGDAPAAALAGRLAADSRRLGILLDGLCALGLLQKRKGSYRNGPVAREFLLDGPKSKAAILRHLHDGWADWGALDVKVRAGRKGRAQGSDLQENFIRGMEENARERAEAVAERFPLRPGERLLDLGGGPGTYASAWARRYPGVEVTVFDIPETLRVARKILSGKGPAGLLRLSAGDFLRDPIGGPYDFVWISQILHAFSRADCLAILKKAHAALAPGGRVAVQEFVLDESKISPPGPAVFSVHMVAVTEGGQSWTAKEIGAMLAEAGFARIKASKADARGVGIATGAVAPAR